MPAPRTLQSPLLIQLAECPGGPHALKALTTAVAARDALDIAWAKYISQPGAKFGSNTDVIEPGNVATKTALAAVGGVTFAIGIDASYHSVQEPTTQDLPSGENMAHLFTTSAGVFSVGVTAAGLIMSYYGVASARATGRANVVNRRCGQALLADSEARLALSTVLAIEPADIKAVTDSYTDAVSKELPAVRQVIGTVAPSGPEL